MNSILLNVKMMVENQTKTQVWEESSLCPETSNKNAIQEFHPWRRLLLLPSGGAFFHCLYVVGPVKKGLFEGRDLYSRL